MDATDVRRAVARVGLTPTTVRQIEGGWANWTFELEGTLIVRFPRTDAVGLATSREIVLLPALAPALSFAIPQPTHVGVWNDRPFFAYPKIAGRPLAEAGPTSAMASRIGKMLEEIHRFPVGRAAVLLQRGDPAIALRARFEDLWCLVAGAALPEMDSPLADAVRREYDTFLGWCDSIPTALVHGDMGPEHVLIDPSGAPCGLIDFEDATVGDPAGDVSGLVPLFGAEHLPELIAGRDLGPRLAERLWFYRWMGSVHAVIYGVIAGVEAERVGGLLELRRRIAEPLLPITG